MKIEFDNQTETDMFKALLDSFIAFTELEEDEQNFINRIYECITKETNGCVEK